MKRFSFRLLPLLELRKQKEEAIKRELGRKNGEIAASQNAKTELLHALHDLQDTEKSRRMLVLDAIALRASVVYRHKLKADIDGVTSRIVLLEQETAGIRQRLVKATQARRMLELLRERRHLAWRKETNREQQAFNDDVSQQGYIRRQAAARQST
jgi:flagellar export protein FliJ